MTKYQKVIGFKLLQEAEDIMAGMDKNAKLKLWPTMLRINILIGNLREDLATHETKENE